MDCNGMKHFNHMAGASPICTEFWQTFIHSFTEYILNAFYVSSVGLGAGRNNPMTLIPVKFILCVCACVCVCVCVCVSDYNPGPEDHSRGKASLL